MTLGNRTHKAKLGQDLRGATVLAADAVAGLAGLVEAMHANIARLPGRAAPPSGRTGGITGLVYGTVRGITRVAGKGLDVVLGQLEPLLGERSSTPGREAALAALNGVMGDALEARANPLAITMSLRSGGVPLELTPQALAAALPQANGKLLVLLHGLCMNDLQWARQDADFGAALARDLGVTPIYLHYNTGRHVSTNGRDFAALMEALVRAWPVALESIDLVAHSMGGLVARSALQRAEASGQAWRQRVRKLVLLGTPHHGAPLERGGHKLDMLMSFSPYTTPFTRLARLRSAGITDLRHGSLLDSDWNGADRFAHGADTRTPVPLPAGIESYAIAAFAGASVASAPARLLGDGLVSMDSALGRHADARFVLPFPADRQWVALSTRHLELQTSPEVYARVRGWLHRPLHRRPLVPATGEDPR